MAEIGIMVEGQEDMTWERFFRLAEAVEDLGFSHLFRSDHLTGIYGHPERASLALWPSLTALAMRTKRIRFGPMVCAVTFRHPVMVAKMAASVDQLSGGRLDLGLGAGWNDMEHKMFGVNYPRYGVRLEMLDEAATVIKSIWSGEPVTFTGNYYQLEEAQSHPGPAQPNPTLIMGGKGEKTLKIVAKHATEWNFSYGGVDLFREKSRELDQNCAAINRDPGDIRRSMMAPFVIGRDEAAAQSRIDAHRRMFSSLPATLAEWNEAGFIGGSPSRVIDQMKAFTAAGIDRFMLQHNDLDDIDSLTLLATEVLPHV
ncbi:MAG TPA: TIGR03560 family F420-dependent LLM class oxidoreductase [Anaerolineae bacterium]|nr:TIGR03560 family F420-dependent LLM class oxidoreductase [Anaerolineae bacterium]MCB9108843.1 TIGR03560 family F420-dependent LLM class oxidoreductase [Anaerolineales bacterium]HRV91922.1 TIGR03560 family F420-dependent LLM class oxidoreductase [Anaerolineae bacterium]